jgi:predicted nuclease of restriction endonuclease-like (RecB) superfamily
MDIREEADQGPLQLNSYADFLADLKKRIRAAQVRAVLSVNRELVLLYWQIGRDILDRQERESWGSKVVDRLAVDLKRAFPEMKGFSPRNLKPGLCTAPESALPV